MDPVFAFFLLIAFVVVVMAVLVKSRTFPLLVEITKNVTVELPVEAEDSVRQVVEAYAALDKIKAGSMTLDDETVKKVKSLVAASIEFQISVLTRENNRLQESIIQNKRFDTFHSLNLASEQEKRIRGNTNQIEELVAKLEELCLSPSPV